VALRKGAHELLTGCHRTQEAQELEAKALGILHPGSKARASGTRSWCKTLYKVPLPSSTPSLFIGDGRLMHWGKRTTEVKAAGTGDREGRRETSLTTRSKEAMYTEHGNSLPSHPEHQQSCPSQGGNWMTLF
jgi:hypothetical protein